MKRITWIAGVILVLIASSVVLYFLLKKTHNPFDINISEVQMDLTFVDLNSQLKQCDSRELLALRDTYKKNDSEVLDYLMGGCIGIDLDVDSVFTRKVKEFYAYDDIKQLENGILTLKIDKLFKQDITDAFKRLKAHVPGITPPNKIVFVNSCFCVNAILNNQPSDIPIGAFVIPKEKVIIVQQEKYIGGNLALLQTNPLNEYIHNWTVNGYRKEFLKRDIVEAWLEQSFFPRKKDEQADVIHEAVRFGKILYFLNAAFPTMSEDCILRYSPSKKEWAKNEEKAIWAYLVENELLFQSNDKTIMGLFSEGPFTPNLAKDDKNDSPDRIGKFIGFRMVQEFMQDMASENFGLDKLMATSAEEIYKSYKP